jgi:hypothetical protein
MPSQLDAVFGWGIALIGLTAVAAAARQIATAVFQEEEEKLELLPAISSDKRLELEEKYGRWAVVTAIGVCPHDDWRCIEREAKRLYESRVYRRM